MRRYVRGLSEGLRRARSGNLPRPNILFILTDQFRWDAMGCSGGWVETPALDRIAAEGVRFANAYTNSPVCIPARLSLATGKYPHQHFVWDNRRYALSPKATTWMQVIRDAGYRTSVFGKMQLYPARGDLRDQEWLANALGLDDVDEVAGPMASLASRSNLIDLWEAADVYKAFKEDFADRQVTKPWVTRPTPLPFELYPDVYVARKATEYLRNYDGEQPWFCWVSFPGPHDPWDTPEPYASRYSPDSMPPPVPAMERKNPQPTGFMDSRLARQVSFEEGDVAKIRADYAGRVALIDEHIGGILQAIEKRGDLDRTVIAFASEHGEMNGDHGLIHKKTFLNGAVKVPLLVRVPGQDDFARGVVSSALVELMDVGATLAALAGRRKPKGSRARSLVPVLKDPGRNHRSIVVSGLKREIMIASTDWKLVLNEQGQPYVLIDLQRDPDESINLVGDAAYDKVIEALLGNIQTSHPRLWVRLRRAQESAVG